MQSCIDHRAADLRSVETQLAIYKRTSKMFEDVGKAYTKALRKANEVSFSGRYREVFSTF